MSWITRVSVAILMIAGVVACSSHPIGATPTGSELRNGSSPELAAANFGGLIRLVGKSFVDYKYSGLEGRPVIHTLRWIEYGLVVEHRINFPSGSLWVSRYQLRPGEGVLDYVINGDFRERGLRPDSAGRIHHAGSTWSPKSAIGAAVDGSLEILVGDETRVSQQVDEKQIAEIRTRYQREKREANEQFWKNVSDAMKMFSQTYVGVPTEQAPRPSNVDQRRSPLPHAAQSQADLPHAKASSARDERGTSTTSGLHRLVFYVHVPLAQPLNGQNGTCASQVFDVPVPGWHPNANDVSAIQALIAPYQDRLLFTCRRNFQVDENAAKFRGNVVWSAQHSPQRVRELHEDLKRRGQAILQI